MWNNASCEPTHPLQLARPHQTDWQARDSALQRRCQANVPQALYFRAYNQQIMAWRFWQPGPNEARGPYIPAAATNASTVKVVSSMEISGALFLNTISQRDEVMDEDALLGWQAEMIGTVAALFGCGRTTAKAILVRPLPTTAVQLLSRCPISPNLLLPFRCLSGSAQLRRAPGRDCCLRGLVWIAGLPQETIGRDRSSRDGQPSGRRPDRVPSLLRRSPAARGVRRCVWPLLL